MWTNPGPFEWAKTAPIEEIGMGGYCKVVCELLHERLPDAEIYGFPNEMAASFEHVFLVIHGNAIDIKGVRTFGDIIQDVGPENPPRKITPKELNEAPFGCDDPEEGKIIERRLRAYIDENAAKFGL
jgi:hypothetical protein